MLKPARILTVATIAIVAAFSLSGCTEDSLDSEGNCPGGVGSTCEKTVQYKGHPLNCVGWNGSHGEVGLDCDWIEYHEKFDPAK